MVDEVDGDWEAVSGLPSKPDEQELNARQTTVTKVPTNWYMCASRPAAGKQCPIGYLDGAKRFLRQPPGFNAMLGARPSVGRRDQSLTASVAVPTPL
jgi:hypothetical protein